MKVFLNITLLLCCSIGCSRLGSLPAESLHFSESYFQLEVAGVENGGVQAFYHFELDTVPGLSLDSLVLEGLGSIPVRKEGEGHCLARTAIYPNNSVSAGQWRDGRLYYSLNEAVKWMPLHHLEQRETVFLPASATDPVWQ